MISKENFVKVIKAIENQTTYINKLYDDFHIDLMESPICALANEVEVFLIHEFGLSERFNDISYWMWELDFGRKWKPGTVTNDGQDVKLETAEDLYDLITM